MINIIIPTVFLSGLGIVFGIVLCYASKKFFVPVAEAEQKIIAILPGANCGACGYSGCAGYAAAIAKNNADINACLPGGEKVMNELSKLLGKNALPQIKMVAEILCKGTAEKTKMKFKYSALKDCKYINGQFNNIKICNNGCIEFGNCYRVCKFNAISYDTNNPSIPKIIIENCTGCGACVKECPKKIIVLRPIDKKVHIKCSNTELGKIAKTQCSVACIACRLCEKNCPVNAIKIENNIAVMDYSKCINCGKCIEVCPIKPEKVIINN